MIDQDLVQSNMAIAYCIRRRLASQLAPIGRRPPAILLLRLALSAALSLLLGHAAIAGEPAVTLSGTVADAEGKSVPGAMVVVAEGPPAVRSRAQQVPRIAPLAPDVLAMATSDDSGKFSISLPNEAPELASRRTRLTVWSYHSEFALAVRLIDRDWPRAGLPLTLNLPAADSVRLKITDANYRPVANARITLLRVAGHLVPDVLRTRLAADTGSDGRATLTGVVPDELDVVRVENQAIEVQWVGLPAQRRDKIVLLSLAPVGRLKGRLMADDPRAVRRRKLRFATWQMPGDEYAGGGLADVVTDDDGHYLVPALAAGSVTFKIAERLDAAGTDPVYLSPQTVGPAVEAGQTTTFEIPLRRAVAVTQEVRDLDGDAPIAGVRVSMSPGLPGDACGDTDSTGSLRVHILPGLVEPTAVRVPSPYYPPDHPIGAEIAESTDVVSLKMTWLARGVSVRGRVVDENERPLAGAEVVGFWKRPTNFNETVHVWSNARGGFTVEAVAAQTPVLLWARHGNSTSIEPVSAQPGGKPVILIVGKEPGVSLDGRVVDAAGQPIAAAVVRISATQRQFVAGFESIDLGFLLFDGNDRLMTDADGRFHTPPSLRPNAQYSLEVTAPGMLPSYTETIEPESWHTTRFTDVELRPAPRLRVVQGRVIDRHGRAVADAAVWQSGDGPRRTQTTTDVEGQFQLGGVYDAPAILFVRKEGFRLQGVRVAPADKTCQINLRRDDEPAAAVATLPPLLSLDEQRELAMSLVEPLLPMLQDRILSSDHLDLLRIVARSAPARALELADAVTDRSYATWTRLAAALSILSIDFDEGLATIACLDQPVLRVRQCVFAFYELADAPRERRVRLLEEALRDARTEPDPGLKLWELGRIGVAWLDQGERERGVAILREGQVLAEALPAPDEANLRESTRRGQYAGMLARIDGPAALRLIDGFSGTLLSHFRTDVARGLADHDPVEAERLFKLIESPPVQPRMRLAPLQRMAICDAERASRLARSYIDLCERAFAVGTVAHGLAPKDRAGAARLLAEAYDLLDRAYQLGPTQYGYRDPALTAAALLPVAEKIDPTLVEGYFWRALSLREPWPTPGESAWIQNTHLGKLAAMIAQYDRGIARDLLWPLAGRLRETLAEGGGGTFMMALAVTDARWAAELVQTLPDTPAPPTKNPKQVAARLLAKWLALPPRGLWGMWETVYLHCDLRDPDTLDDVW
jgi:protocatechuate 3,4-dioxygenase beta subunit